MIGLSLTTKQNNPQTWIWPLAALIAYSVFRFAVFQKTSIREEEIYAVLGGVIGIGLFVNGFDREKLRRKILNLPTSRVRSMALGTVELTGVSQETDQPLFDPLYNQRCTYYSIQVREKRGGGRNSRWVTVYSKNSDAFPFYLKDPTGRVLIIPHGAENRGGLFIKKRYGGAVFGSGGSTVEDAFMIRYGGKWGSKILTARIIRDGMPLYVLGFAQTLPHQFRSEGSVGRAEAAKVLKSNKTMMASLDTNHDGHIDSLEWEEGVERIRKEMESVRMRNAEKENQNIFTQPLFVGENNASHFVIAQDEKDLLNAVAFSALWQVIVGPLLTAGCAFFLSTILIR